MARGAVVPGQKKLPRQVLHLGCIGHPLGFVSVLVQVPKVLWRYTTSQVLTMEYTPGVKINRSEYCVRWACCPRCARCGCMLCCAPNNSMPIECMFKTHCQENVC